MRRPRLTPLRAAATAVLTALLLPASAVALAGGGSGGFSGGGGGGGGFSGGGGGGGFGGGGFSGGGATASPGASFVILAIILIVIAVSVISSRRRAIDGTWTKAGARKRDAETAKARERRAREVQAAAFTAASDDPDFAPEVVVPQAEQLFRDIQKAWDDEDIPALERMVGPELMVEWRRRLEDFAAKGWHNRVVVRENSAEYVGMRNLPAEEDDRVVVRVSAVCDDWVVDANGTRMHHSGNDSSETWVREYWTLVMRDGRWTLGSIEQDREGEHQLTEPLVAERGDDVSGLRDETVVEQAVADRVPNGDVAALTPLDFPEDAAAAAREMALVDQRFEPDVIEVAVRRAVAAWAEAIDGEDDALLAISDPVVVNELLYHGDTTGRTRVVVRGPVLKGLHVLSLDTRALPPRVAVSADVEGARYIEDRDTTTVLQGDPKHRQPFTLRLDLALGDDPRNPWRLVAPQGVPGA
ncbi:MAG TPA: TIM44-like domain-containing protein [Miltoncostaea sp.]|nr:TIM44-like domain-containing protein [Miltoncostaea sp.]